MPQQQYFIRPGKNSDIPTIKSIVFGVLKEHGLKHDEEGKDRDLNDIEQSYFNNNGYFGVVVDGGNDRIIGTFGLTSIGQGDCELRKMYLLGQARGQGLGKLMLETAVEIARQRQYKRIVLETISPLQRAISLYKKFGFREIPPHNVNDRVDQAFELIL